MSSPNVERRRSSSSNPREKFPDFQDSQSGDYFPKFHEGEVGRNGAARTSSPTKSNGVLYNQRWQIRKDNHLAWGDGHLHVASPRQHERHRSISDTFRNIRTRKASVSENAQEIAEALKAPISFKILVSVPVVSIMHQLTRVSDAMPYMVLELGLDQYFLQVHSQRFP